LHARRCEMKAVRRYLRQLSMKLNPLASQRQRYSGQCLNAITSFLGVERAPPRYSQGLSQTGAQVSSDINPGNKAENTFKIFRWPRRFGRPDNASSTTNSAKRGSPPVLTPRRRAATASGRIGQLVPRADMNKTSTISATSSATWADYLEAAGRHPRVRCEVEISRRRWTSIFSTQCAGFRHP
jgi:hypothetical protein